MKVVLRGYGPGMTPGQKQNAKLQAADLSRTRGTSRIPDPPRGVFCQSASRGILVTWNLPDGFAEDIQRWRVYKNDEDSLYEEIKDRGTRQCFVASTAGTTPPVVNVFVSSLNAAGVESQKVHAQGSATAETGAPSIPIPPPEYQDIDSGGGDTRTDYQ